jgi:hypothetical protein
MNWPLLLACMVKASKADTSASGVGEGAGEAQPWNTDLETSSENSLAPPLLLYD